MASIKTYIGSAWVIKPVKVWNGSTWNVKPVKEWNGSSWILTNQSSIVSGYKVFLDAGNPASYSGSGSIMTNLGSATANGTIISGSYNPAGGGSIAFNGTSTYIDCGADASIADFAAFTVSTWFYITSTATGMNIVYKSNDNASAGWFQDLRVGYAQAGCSIVNSTANTRNYIDINNIPVNQWVNFVSTWTGGVSYSSLTNYVNGVKFNPIVTVNGTGTRTSDISQPLQIGRRRTGAYVYFNGLISNVLIYDRGLTDAEVLQNYNAIKGRFI